MKIAVFGAAGSVGRCVVAEALARGHEVTAIVRRRSQFADIPPGADTRVGDAANADEVAALSVGQDVVVNATRPPSGHENEVEGITQSLLDGLARADVRLLVVGGAATLTVPGTNGRAVLDDARFVPASVRPVAKASAEQLRICLAETRIDWAYLSPPAHLLPGTRTGKYRLGTDELLVDASGHSRLSVEDLAVVLLDEAERPRHHWARFTAAY